MAGMDEKERLRKVRELTDRLGSLNVQLDHLGHFIRYAHESKELQDDLRDLMKTKDKERLDTHKQLVKLATKPKGYRSAGMLIQDSKKGKGKRE